MVSASFSLSLYSKLTILGPLLDHIQNLLGSRAELPPQTLALAAEASWTTGRWNILEQFLESEPCLSSQDFNVGIGKALLALKRQDQVTFNQTVSTLRGNVTGSLSVSATSSLAAAQPHTIKLHALYELELISGMGNMKLEPNVVMDTLDRRLGILGAFTDNQQYLLGLRRAVMSLSR